MTRFGAAFVLVLFLSAIPLIHAQDPVAIVIPHALVYDGTDTKPTESDVGTAGDRIRSVAKRIPPAKGEEVVDAHGLALALRFLDMHSHADSGIFKDPDAELIIRQGVTTVLVGQDGESEYPLADFFTRLEKTPATINIASLAGQGTLREQVMSNNLLRPSRPDELAKMKVLLKQQMDAGAFGLSTGLEYDPAHFSTTDEVVELSGVAAAKRGFYISHVRDEGDKAFQSFSGRNYAYQTWYHAGVASGGPG